MELIDAKQFIKNLVGLSFLRYPAKFLQPNYEGICKLADIEKEAPSRRKL
jgi:hypothetical protein